MGNVRVIDVHQSVYAVNDEIAAKTRARLKDCLLYTSDAADEL